jgi:hypothetical protein
MSKQLSFSFPLDKPAIRPGTAPTPATSLCVPKATPLNNNADFSHDELARRLVNLLVLYRSEDVPQRRRRAGFQHVSEIIFGDIPEGGKAA